MQARSLQAQAVVAARCAPRVQRAQPARAAAPVRRAAPAAPRRHLVKAIAAPERVEATAAAPGKLQQPGKAQDQVGGACKARGAG